MSPQDVAYYRERAAAERALAIASDRVNVAAIHEELARQYQALVDQEELRPPSELVAAMARRRQASA